MACSQTCELYTSLLAALLESLIAGGRAPVHALPDGTRAALVAVDVVDNRVQLAFSGLMISPGGDDARAFCTPETLCASTRRSNHRFLRLTLREVASTGRACHLWCDPTARQVFSDLPVVDAGGAPIHATFWAGGRLPREYTPRSPPRLLTFVDALRTTPGVAGKCCLPLAMHAVDSDPCADERTWRSVAALFDEAVPFAIDWGAVEARALAHQRSGRPTSRWGEAVSVC